jgi:broad specificity phosphatase PhoE
MALRRRPSARWTSRRCMRQAAGMLRVARVLLCLLAVSSYGTATADPKAGTPSDSKSGAPAGTKAGTSVDTKAAPAEPKAATPGIKTIIVVRHAEAAGDTHKGGDPVLSADGRTRAQDLARALTDAPLRSVYITHYQRNRQTAERLPRGAGEKPTVIDDVAATLRALQAEPWGATALVIGHSNTVPELIRGLTGQALPDGEPIIYDRMWIVTIARDGATSLLKLHYGAPVPVKK